jgi:hypothetical protein
LHGGAVLLNTGVNIFSKSSLSHGNSATSTKPQHGYEIVDQAGDVKKVGVSGQPLNQSGTSPRATPQVNKANKTRTGANLVAADQACGGIIVGASSTAEALSEGKSNCKFASPAPSRYSGFFYLRIAILQARHQAGTPASKNPTKSETNESRRITP